MRGVRFDKGCVSNGLQGHTVVVAQKGQAQGTAPTVVVAQKGRAQGTAPTFLN